MIRGVTDKDLEALSVIYNYYIDNTVITFEEEHVTPSQFGLRIEKVRSDNLPWLVAEKDGEVIGYAYGSMWNQRCAYKYTVESTIYLSHKWITKGWGSRLYDALFAELRKKSFHVIIGGITLPNQSSVALHEKFGMKKVAHFEQVGFKFGKWLDVGYWQLNTNIRGQ